MPDDRSASNWVGSFRVGKEAVNGVVCYYTSTSLQLSLGGMVTGGVNRSGIWEVYVVGWPGTCGDSLVYKRMQLHLNPSQYFDDGQYLLADSAYEVSKTVVPA
ncbi:hypothetical protein PGT21_029322 [Puccinia graminis f. sp. tritici]|uniref:DDE Tnp4 domain-containing protein n=1 Tax=Puccinia graminis f. sp. tritici TaxID=56615 RepID=A0A5B0MMV6_PUCGR|nr:hypothetical protein PGT21_029322 [Puccinia graminis f. sp. tritici]